MGFHGGRYFPGWFLDFLIFMGRLCSAGQFRAFLGWVFCVMLLFGSFFWGAVSYLEVPPGKGSVFANAFI